MAIAWIIAINNTSGNSYNIWVEGVPVTGGHTGKSPSYNGDKEWGTSIVEIPNNASWIVSDCAIPFYSQSGKSAARRYIKGPGGTVYFDVAKMSSNKTMDGIYCYNDATGLQVGDPIPVGPTDNDGANTAFGIVIQSSSATPPGISFAYHSSAGGGSGLQADFAKAEALLAPLITAIISDASS